jgi:mechanosensitive ion channel-like protein
MPTTTISSWGDAVFLSLSNALNSFLAAIPLVIGALLIIVIGWIIAGVLARVVQELLRRAGADRLFAEHGGQVYGSRSQNIKPSIVASELVKWLVRLVFLVAAANVLGMPQVSELLNDVLLWIPNLIVAAIILLVAPLLARFVRGAIEVGAGQMGFSNAPLLGRIAEIAIIAFAVIIAINQIGIAANLVNTLFVGIVAALALAFGLAFGLGGREVAAQLTQSWYAQSQSAAARVRAHQATTGDEAAPAGAMDPTGTVRPRSGASVPPPSGPSTSGQPRPTTGF